MEFLDLHHNVDAVAGLLYDSEQAEFISSYVEEEPETSNPSPRSAPKIDACFYQVRKSICITGFHGPSVLDVKHKVAGLITEPCALESFHVRNVSDIKEGAFLVPKIILVATHWPGKKILDQDGDTGQLDLLYDEACNMGADIMVVIVGLPKSIYRPIKHIIYHPKMEEVVFPGQPLLRHLANENCFITVCENCDLTYMQKNVIREWMSRPVNDNHPVFEAADYLSSCEMTNDDLENILKDVKKQSEDAVKEPEPFKPATEHHPLAEKKKKKKKREKNKKTVFGFNNPMRKNNMPGKAQHCYSMDVLDEEIEESNRKRDHQVEMDMHKMTESSMEMGGQTASVF